MIKNKEAEILLLGLPNSGKSTLINALTKNKTSIIGSKPNTTRDKISKIVNYENDKNILISDLPGFLEKNNIPKEDVLKSKLLTDLLNDDNRQIIVKDCEDGYHFNGSFNNINSLIDALKNLPEKYSDTIKKERNFIYDLFEKVFDHKSFTGRSGTFYGYEGLG